ncbi:MAG: MFS transporter [Candidatus Woesearchaeota archaeon]
MPPYKSNIWKLCLFQFLTHLHFIGGVLVIFFTDWGKISFSQIMILEGFYTICCFLLEVPTGAVADYIGRKLSLTLGALSTFFGALIYSSYPSYALFFVAEFVWALGYAFVSGAYEAILYDSLKKVGEQKKSKAIFAKGSTFQILGIGVAAPIGSLIAAWFGLRYTMMFMAVPMFLAFLISLTLEEPKTRRKLESKRYLLILVKGIKYFRDHKVLRMLAFDCISISTLAFFLFWIYQPLLQQLNFPLAYFGVVAAAITGAELLVINGFEKLEKIFGSKKSYLLWSAIIAGVAFVAVGLANSLYLTLALLPVISGFGIARGVLFQSYFNKYIKSQNRATVNSALAMIERFVRAILYVIMSVMVQWSLNYTFVFVGLAILIFAWVSKVEEKHLIDA